MLGIQVIMNVTVINLVDVGEYLNYSDCKCKKRLADKLIDECIETIEKTKLVNITFTENENDYECGYCILYVVLMIVAFTIFNRITAYLVYYTINFIIIIIIIINNNNDNDDNHNKNKNLMNVIIKNGYNKTNKY